MIKTPLIKCVRIYRHVIRIFFEDGNIRKMSPEAFRDALNTYEETRKILYSTEDEE